MQYETALGLHRAAAEHRQSAQILISAFQIQLIEQLAQVEFRVLVKYQAHGALRIMLADQRHRTRKMRVLHARHGD